MCEKAFNMAELSSSKPVVHVSPIWPKRKERKSFRNVVRKLVDVLRFVQKVRNLSIYGVSEQRNYRVGENLKKEERLKKVKSLAKLKKDGADERKQNGRKIHREKLRYLSYLERMCPASTSYWKNKPTRNALSIGKLRHFNNREKKLFDSSIWMKSSKTDQKVKVFNQKESLNEVASVINRRGEDSILAKGRSNQLSNAWPSTISKAIEMKRQLSSLDAKLDPRFQNLLRTLTPIDC